MTITGEVHESPITGGVDGARDRRGLHWYLPHVASNCNGGWCVCPPRPCFPPLRNLAAPFLPAADHTARRQAATLPRSLTAGTVLATTTVGLAAMPAVFAIMVLPRLPAVNATVIPLTQAVVLATPPATPAVPPALLAHTAPQARHSWPCVPWPSRQAAHALASCRRTRTTGLCATTRHYTPTNGACVRAQNMGRTVATLTAPARRPRAMLVRPAPHHSTSIATARQGGLKPATAPARRARSAPHHSTSPPAARRAA